MRGTEPATPPDDSTIAVSLSGGGVRSMLFCLGALRALVPGLGARRTLAAVASVSGGSMGSAFAFSRHDLADPVLTPEQFDAEVLAPAYRAISRRSVMWDVAAMWAILGVILICSNLALTLLLGAHRWSRLSIALVVAVGWGALAVSYFRFPRERLYALALVVLAAALSAATALVQIPFPVRLPAALVALAAGITALGSRGHALERGLHLTLFPPDEPNLPQLLSDIRSKADLVLTSSDLNTGMDLFLTPRGIESPRWGRAEVGALPLVHAVRASASFPGVLPPLRLKELKFPPHNASGQQPPDTLALADGGVYDNLGSEWLLTWHTKPATYLVVVNASPRLTVQRSRFNVWLLGELAALLRMEGIQYAATTGPRQRWLHSLFVDAARFGVTGAGARNGTIVSISKSILEWVQEFSDAKWTDGRGDRARAIQAELLAVCNEKGWEDWAKENATVATSFERLDAQTARRLIRLGYLAAAIQLHVLQDWEKPPSVNPDDLFVDLLR